MTAAEKLYQLIQTLSENQINEVLHFAESLHQKQLTSPAPSLDSEALPNVLGQPLAMMNCKQITPTT